MDIIPKNLKISELLNSNYQFVIPRYQREYSWEKKNYKEFLDDLLSQLTIKDQNVICNQHFIGTMLFIGDGLENGNNELGVVDGQQRLTTITILLSVLTDYFINEKEEELAKRAYGYIMTQNNQNGLERILKNETSSKFFGSYIQDAFNPYANKPLIKAETEEERRIQEVREYFKKQLSDKKIKKYLKERNVNPEIIKNLKYVDFLQGILNQILNSTVISIQAKDRKQANMVFEVLNAKGKQLSRTDLIKNKIFEVLNDEEPTDYAADAWKEIKERLNDREAGAEFSKFYRYFWISKYKKSSDAKLYDDFKSMIKPADKENYLRFINEMKDTVDLYVVTVAPRREDFENKKQYYELVQSIKVMSSYFKITQVRVALIALLEAEQNRMIAIKKLKDVVGKLENFHFSYSAVCSKPANKLDKIYSDFSIALRNTDDKNEAREIIDNLLNQLDDLYVTYEEFENGFIKLTYAKKGNEKENLKTKYAINKIACSYAGKQLFDDYGSIEHIYPEANSDESHNIGNLILLEQDLNEKAGSLNYEDKIKIYKHTEYEWVKKFMDEYPEWSAEKIQERSKKLAKFYYTRILDKTI